RRVAGTKVVYADAESLRTQALDQRVGPRSRVEHDALGDLQHQLGRIQAEFAHDRKQRRFEIDVEQFGSRYVDVDRKEAAAPRRALPKRDLRTGGSKHETSDRHGKARLF